MPRNVNEIVNRLLAKKPSVSAGELARAVGISRQAAHRHLRRLVSEGLLVREGAGRSARYRRGGTVDPRTGPAPASREVHSYRASGLDESRVWDELVRSSPLVGALTGEGRAAFQYALTEMLNNAIEHARAERIEVLLERSGPRLAFEVVDDGVGVFRRLREGLALEGDLAAIQELSKGKVTTDPSRHTGEGIFFTAKVADLFELDSGDIVWVVDNLREDMTVRSIPPRAGTRVRFEIQPVPLRRLADVFAEYTKDFAFSKTRTIVKLFAIGTTFVSRSEARRLVHGLERFREVILDFAGVESVGQGFVDEVFRVWATAHPETRLVWVNANPAVTFMIERGLPK